jgi:hypothetical protein
MERQTPMPLIAGVIILITAGFKMLALLVALGFGLFVLIWPTSGGVLAAAAVGVIVAIALIVLTLLGGIAALQRRRWGLAMAGAIIAAVPFLPAGVAAITLIALSREEFTSSPQ